MVSPLSTASLRQRIASTASWLLRVLAVVLLALWLQSLLRGTAIERRTTVLSGDVVETTDAHQKMTEFISHHRILSSHRHRIYIIYMRAEELAKSADLPRRVNWHVSATGEGRHDRYDAPGWLAWLGFDWRFRSAEGMRPNGEFWSNGSIFLTLPYWALVAVSGAGGWLVGRRKRIESARIKHGLCPACGYDLRSGHHRCPECGSPAIASA